MEPKKLRPEEREEIKADHRLLHLLPSDRVVGHIVALEAEIARLKPSGQVAEDEKCLIEMLRSERGCYCQACRNEKEARALISHLVAKAQGYEAAVADNAALLNGLRVTRAAMAEVDDDKAPAELIRAEVRVSLTLAIDHPGATLLDAILPILDLPYTIDESTIPASGPDTAPDQVVGTLHISLAKMRALKKALQR